MASENAETAATAMERTINSFGSDDNSKYIVEKMLTMHRTLNQKFTGEIILPFIQAMAQKYDAHRFDLRNEAACKVCRVMWDAIKAEYEIEDDAADFRLPVI